MEGNVYLIRNTATGRVYVGATRHSPRMRFGGHMSLLRYGKHHNRGMQQDYDEHGESSFVLCWSERCRRPGTTELRLADAMSGHAYNRPPITRLPEPRNVALLTEAVRMFFEERMTFCAVAAETGLNLKIVTDTIKGRINRHLEAVQRIQVTADRSGYVRLLEWEHDGRTYARSPSYHGRKV